MTDKCETYTAKECAHRMGISPNSLRNLIRTKQVPFGIAYRLARRNALTKRFRRLLYLRRI